MGLNSLQQIAGLAVMEEEDPLSNAPQWGCAEHIALCETLRDAIGKAWTHVVQEEIREQIDRLVLKRLYFGSRGGLHGRRVAQKTTDAWMVHIGSE